MSPDRQIALLARHLAETKAALAAKTEGKDLEDAIGDPFRFVANQIGDMAAVVFFIRFDINSLGDGLRALAVMLALKNSPPSARELLKEFDDQQQGSFGSRWRAEHRSEREMAEHALALARMRADEGTARGGPDLKRTVRDPFRFLADRIGEQAAVAFCIRFNAKSIHIAVRALAWMLVYQESPPSFSQLLSEMVGEQQVDLEDIPLSSLRIQ